MMNKVMKFCFLCVALILLSCATSIPAQAGQRTFETNLFTESGTLNSTDWNSTDHHVYVSGGQLIIPSKTSTADTKLISKNAAVAHENLKDVISVSASLKITSLPGNQKLILGLGLGSIEASSGENGNVEIVFTNNGGLYVTVISYNDQGQTTVVGRTKCDIPLNSNFEFEASISNAQVLTVKIGNHTICNKKISVDGSGRFGIIQTGSCGVNIARLHASNYRYDTPQNTNISENFEKNEWNANLLNAQLFGSNGLGTGSMSIEQYKGSKVLMVQNAGTTSGKVSSYISTLQKYSNFEISFDVPYFQRTNDISADGVLLKQPCTGLYLSFGMEQAKYNNLIDTKKYNTDALVIGTNRVTSVVTNPDLKVNLDEFNLFTPNSNEGFSVKFTMIDGEGTLQMKALSGNEWKTVVIQDYTKTFREGYVALWTVTSGDYALDNLKITNRDASPKTIEMPYKSSVIKAEDYVLTEEEKKLVFRDGTEYKEELEAQEGEERQGTSNGILGIGDIQIGDTVVSANILSVVALSAISVILVCGSLLLAFAYRKKKLKKGVEANEEK